MKNGNFDHSRDKVAPPPPIRPISVSAAETVRRSAPNHEVSQPRTDGATRTTRYDTELHTAGRKPRYSLSARGHLVQRRNDA